MSKIIISESLYQRLGTYAQGFDTPQAVIERILDRIEKTDLDKEIIEKKEDTPLLPRTKAYIQMTPELMEQIYNWGKDVFEGKIDIYTARNSLAKAGMNKTSATIYLFVHQYMMAGRCYKRAINGASTEYFLEKIKADYGLQYLEKALLAVEQHMQYRASLHDGKEPRNIRRIYDGFVNELDDKID